MPGWLKWKKPKLISRAARTPVPFSIQCVCGRQAEGQRSPRYQQVICLDCGEPLFVLPLNAYPAPTIADAETQQQPAPDGSAVDSTDTNETDVAPTATATAKKTRPKAKTKKDKRQKTKPAPRPDAVPLSRIKRPGKRIVTPFRLTLIAITGVLIGTVWYSVQSSRFENAEVTLRTASENGFTAIENNDFLTAAAEFQKATVAAAVVAPQSLQARMLGQMRDQLQVATNLTADSLIDILQSASDANQQQPGSWRDSVTFDTDTWMVIDSTGRQTTGRSGGRIVEVAFPYGLDGADVVIDCSFAPFAKLNIGSTPRRIIVAAQLSGLDYQDTTPARWIIHLNPETIVIWSDQRIFDSLGFELDDGDQATSELLTVQRKSLGIEE